MKWCVKGGWQSSCSIVPRVDGRSPPTGNQALHVLRERCMHDRIGWIIDADVSAFFDSLDHDQLCEVLTPRVKDGAILRLIRKWLKAGVVEGGRHVRLPWTDPLLGALTAGVLGDQAADGQEAVATGDARGVALVPSASARTDTGAVPDSVPEASGPLPVLLASGGTTGSWTRSTGSWTRRGAIG